MCRLLNLELLLQFGPRAWQAHIKHLEAAQQRCGSFLLLPTLKVCCLSVKPCMPLAHPHNIPCAFGLCQTCMHT